MLEEHRQWMQVRLHRSVVSQAIHLGTNFICCLTFWSKGNKNRFRFTFFRDFYRRRDSADYSDRCRTITPWVK